MAKGEHGRAHAPGQNKVHTFVNANGDVVTGTMNDFHDHLREQGYQVQDDDATDLAEDGVPSTPEQPAAPEQPTDSGGTVPA